MFFKISIVKKLYLFVGIGLCTIMMGFTTYLLRSGLNSGYSRITKSEIFQESNLEEKTFDRELKKEVFSELGVFSVKDNSSHSEKVEKIFISPTAETNNYMNKIVYNRVGKCGSRSMLTLITKLANKNNFSFYNSPVSNRTKAPLHELINEVKIINDLPFPSLYSRHLHYVDLFKFGVSGVVYINMIRDPIERFSSQYHFSRYGDGKKPVGRRTVPWEDGEKEMDINECILSNHHMCSAERSFYIVPYFCGQDILCQRPSKESLYRAKAHIMENYLIVGYLEDFTGMLQVLEKLVPKFFDGALQFWKEISKETMSKTYTLQKRTINETAYAVMRERMKVEYDFYKFVKLRFQIIKKQLGIPDVDGNS